VCSANNLNGRASRYVSELGQFGVGVADATVGGGVGKKHHEELAVGVGGGGDADPGGKVGRLLAVVEQL
jgi:hypothetical protein